MLRFAVMISALALTATASASDTAKTAAPAAPAAPAAHTAPAAAHATAPGAAVAKAPVKTKEECAKLKGKEQTGCMKNVEAAAKAATTTK